jgi:hypothetical protein
VWEREMGVQSLCGLRDARCGRACEVDESHETGV